MLKVLSIVDKVGTALDRLAKGVEKYHDNIDYKVLDIHPKRPDTNQLAAWEAEYKDADIIEYQYYRTAEMLRERYEIKAKQILVHNNPYAITESDWNDYDVVVGNNKEIYENLGKITVKPVRHIPLTVDTDFWEFKREWEPNNTVLMVANRIEGKKGILPVAEACKKLGLRFCLVGAISDAEYAKKLMDTGVVDLSLEISDEDLRELYYSSTVHVCNSQDNFESGTLPILESMLCGTPVLTRKVGHVPELYNGENMMIHEGDPEDVEAITKLLEEMFADTDKLNEMRGKAWDTAKTRSHERRAYMYQKLYREVMWPDQKSVSVVMPVYGDINWETVNAINKQDYENLEIILCNDDSTKDFAGLATEGNRLTRVINQPSEGYGLAKQRNLGVIEATGEIIVFCDQRMLMDKNCVSELVKYVAPKKWVYGNKGVKKEFVENLSAVYRDNLIHIGMFCERMDRWGGMSQEIRSRAKYNQFTLEYVESAKATPQGSSKNKHTKRQDVIKIKNRLWKMGMEL